MIGREVTAEEVVREVEKDIVFYQNSEGGVTLSGGEPTVQPEFSTEILRMCQHRGIHTAMETCGYVDWPVLEEMLKYVDLIYVDIKHVSASEHSRLTQKGNRKILSNIRKIAEKHPDTSLIIRIPVIPGYNDTGENMTRTAEFVRQLGRVERIELLPYHRLGVYMYRILAKTYRLTHVEAPEEDRPQYLAELVKDQGVQVQIGG